MTSWISVEGTTNVWAQPRRIPGKADSPVIVHLLNRNYDFATDKIQPQQNIILHLRAPLLGKLAPTKCKAFVPNSEPASLPIEKESDGLRVTVPELGLWSVMVFD
jgi:hypothetical protein